MRLFVRTFAMLVPLAAIVAGLFAEDHTISVTVVKGKDKNTISYTHSKGKDGKSHGGQGHQIALVGETITWACAMTPCKRVAVQFKNDSPCTAPSPTSCMVDDTFGVFPYSITALDANGNVLVIHDPDIIVDNGGLIEDKQNKTPKAKATPKKQ